jgi:hypothetical protein
MSTSTTTPPTASANIIYRRYDPKQEVIQLEAIRNMIGTDLSEPYSIYVYRYFLYQWGDLCYMVSLRLLLLLVLLVLDLLSWGVIDGLKMGQGSH